MGGEGKGGKGKGKGGKGGGKGGKGKGSKGGKDGFQVRRELAGVVGQVLWDGGQDPTENPRNERTRKRKKDRDADWAPVPQDRNGRRAQRKAARTEQKQRRQFHFGGWKQDGAAKEKSGKASAPGGKAAEGGSKGGAQYEGPQPKKKQRRPQEDDDDEITSEEEGDVPTKIRSKKAAKAELDDVSEEASQDAEAGEGEGEEEEDVGAGEDEEEEPAPAKSSAKTAPAQSEAAKGSYVPPHLRGAKAAAKVAEQNDNVTSIRRRLRGVMNRVTEGNLDPSSKELNAILGQLIPEEGSTAAAADLLEVMLPASVNDPNISVLVLGCHAALVIVVHVLYGAAFGAAAMLRVGEHLSRSLSVAELSGEPTGEQARIAKNCVALEALMFSFGLLPGKVMTNLVRFIFEGDITSEVRIELALTVLRYAGRGLRAECPEEFREILSCVSAVVTKAKQTPVLDESGDTRTRLDFLMKELTDLKNNKVTFAAMNRFEAIRTWVKSAPLLSGKKVGDYALDVPFKFLEQDPPDGWPLGSATSASSSSRRASRFTLNGDGGAEDKSADRLRQLAVSQRLTTDLRQSLFVALMGAEDFEHAATRLFEVGSTAKIGTAEACLIVLHCAIREKVPNPYYEHVAEALCGMPAPAGKRFSHAMKGAVVQHLQQAHSYGLRATVALAEFAAAAIASSTVGMPIATLRWVKFAEAEAGKPLGGTLGLLLRHMLESLIRRLPDAEETSKTFEPLQKYEDVREGILLIVDGFVKPRLPPKGEDPLMWDKFRAARRRVASRRD